MYIGCPRDCKRLMHCKTCNKRLCSREYAKLCEFEGHYQYDKEVFCYDCWLKHPKYKLLSKMYIR
jgi:hypothetical protein